MILVEGSELHKLIGYASTTPGTAVFLDMPVLKIPFSYCGRVATIISNSGLLHVSRRRTCKSSLLFLVRGSTSS